MLALCLTMDNGQCAMDNGQCAQLPASVFRLTEGMMRSTMSRGSIMGDSRLRKSLQESCVSLLQCRHRQLTRHSFKIVKKFIQTLTLCQIPPKVFDRDTSTNKAWHSPQPLRINRDDHGTRIRLWDQFRTQIPL